MASLVAQLVKYLLANAGNKEIWVQSLGLGDPLEKEMATCSSILAWKILCTEELGGPTAHGVAESDMTERARVLACMQGKY